MKGFASLLTTPQFKESEKISVLFLTTQGMANLASHVANVLCYFFSTGAGLDVDF
jgi:hypothetical protein